ncbi:hypothetical protein KJ966_08710 [bacterium]|nr:hypothetical protein [bacterium]
MNDKDEEKIQDLIRVRVLEEYKKRQLEEEAKLQSESNIEALHDVTEIPKEDIQKIADQVRAEYQKERAPKKPIIQQSKNLKRYLPFVIIVALLGLLLTGSPTFQRFFTTGISPMRWKTLEQADENKVPGRWDWRQRFMRKGRQHR